MEVWKDIEGYEGYYQVSDNGRIASLRCQRGIRKIPKILKPEMIRKGYLRVGLYGKGGYKKYQVHRLVAIHFIPNPENLPFVNHKDEDKTNNDVSNLEWCTNEYNVNYGTRNLRGGISRKKPIVVYDTDDELISEYPSIKEASNALNISTSHLIRCCRGLSVMKKENYKGLRFEFKNKRDFISRSRNKLNKQFKNKRNDEINLWKAVQCEGLD